VHVASIISLIFQPMHTLHTLYKALKFTLKTLKNLPLHISVPFLRLSSWGSVDSTLSSYQVEIC